MRFARGGKTVSLSKIFDKLKEVPDVHPILISFNGNGPNSFKRRKGETQAQAILRLIAMQLGDYTPGQRRNLVVDRKALDQHLGENVVLLIDELNSLGAPLDGDAAEILREMFLDRSGRFLVFSSHFPVSIETDTVQASVIASAPASLRGVLNVNMSLASTLAELRGMSVDCEALTEENAAWHGYVPSLIYLTMTIGMHDGVVTHSMRFAQMNISVEPDKCLDVLKRFVGELLSGQRDPVVTRYFGAFANVDANSRVSYPLCYVKEILQVLSPSTTTAVTVLLENLLKLESHLNSSKQHSSGLAWECTVQVAIILQMLDATWCGSEGPFELAPVGVQPSLDFRTIPDECNTLESARTFIDAIVVDYKSPTLIYVVSANAGFPAVEGFLVYTDGSSNHPRIVGFGMQTTDVKPRQEMDPRVIDGGAVLIRGHASAMNPREPKVVGWRYMTSEQVRDFLGNSLLLAMPREWLQDP